MTLAFDFRPEARAEFLADVDWCHERGFDVGAHFENAVRETIDSAADSPETWAVWPGYRHERVSP